MSVYKENNSWSFSCRYKDFTGKTKIAHRRGYRTKTEARKAELTFINNHENGDKQMTFENLYQDFLDYKKNRNKDSSIQSINYKVQRHILPYFKNRKVNEITVKDIRDWQNTLDKDKSLSLSYKQSIHARLSSILSHGVKYHNLGKNVAQLNGNFVDPNGFKEEMDFYTYDEWKIFEQGLYSVPDEYRYFFSFLYWTGCRRGEAQALTWNDFEQDFRYVKIKKTLSTKVVGKPYSITTPKTVTSNRKISIPETLRVLLKEKYKDDITIDGFSHKCFVFGTVKPLSDESIRRNKNKAAASANIRAIRTHDFRHSHASFLFGNGVDVTAVSKRLGHKNISVTMTTYIHMMPDAEDKALAILNQFV